MFFSARDSISNFFSKTTWLFNLPLWKLFDHERKSANSVVIICLSFYGSVSFGETPSQEVKHLVTGKNTSQSAFHINSLDYDLSKAVALQESGEHEAAALAFKKVWEIDRIQNGLYSESQVSIIENIIFSSMKLANWDSVNQQFEYLEHLYKRIYDTGNPKLEIGLQKISSWHISALNENLDGHRLMHLRKARGLFKMRLDIAKSTLDAQDPLLKYLKENIALSQRELYLYSDVGREMAYAQTLQSGASLLVKIE
tara:strand:- start:268 stop:1032 length:765 start_codon:yes stop_codon:yes gene_type:complete